MLVAATCSTKPRTVPPSQVTTTSRHVAQAVRRSHAATSGRAVGRLAEGELVATAEVRFCARSMSDDVRFPRSTEDTVSAAALTFELPAANRPCRLMHTGDLF